MAINGSRVKNVTEGKWMTQEYADVPHGAAKSPFPAVYSNRQESCQGEGEPARARGARKAGAPCSGERSWTAEEGRNKRK